MTGFLVNVTLKHLPTCIISTTGLNDPRMLAGTADQGQVFLDVRPLTYRILAPPQLHCPTPALHSFHFQRWYWPIHHHSSLPGLSVECKIWKDGGYTSLLHSQHPSQYPAWSQGLTAVGSTGSWRDGSSIQNKRFQRTQVWLPAPMSGSSQLLNSSSSNSGSLFWPPRASVLLGTHPHTDVHRIK